MRRHLIIGSLTAALTIAVAGPASADSFSLTSGEATALAGVSPFAMTVSGSTDRVFYGSSNPMGWALASCTGTVCSSPAALPVTFGADYTQVTLTDGTQRAYFVNPASGKMLTTAPVAYDAQGTPTLGAATALGISAPAGQNAWGVPDSVVLPDGRVRLYWVTMPAGGKASGPTKAQISCLAKQIGKKRVNAIGSGAKPNAKDKKALRKCKIDPSLLSGGRSSQPQEVIVSATSTDASGTSFAQDPGTRFTGGYVDSDIVQAKDGDWIALLSTGPGAPPQQLYAATSKDGLTWKVDGKALTGSSVNSLDPSAVPAGPNTWRVYWSQSPKATPFSNHTIVVGTLTR